MHKDDMVVHLHNEIKNILRNTFGTTLYSINLIGRSCCANGIFNIGVVKGGEAETHNMPMGDKIINRAWLVLSMRVAIADL